MASSVVSIICSPGACTPFAAVTPASIRPLPIAPARKQQRAGCRKKLASTVLTSTPVKETLREQQRERKAKKVALEEKRNKPNMCRPTPAASKPKKNKLQMRMRKSKLADPLPMTSDEENDGVNDMNLCNDDSDDDIEDETCSRPVCRSVDGNKSKDDTCILCGEFGRDRELWYRCRVCALWAHEACTSAVSANDYVCDYCVTH